MTIPIHFESLLSSVFETTINAFKSGAKEIANNLLMNLIFTLKQQNDELTKIILDLEINPSLALKFDTDEFHDSIIDLEDKIERLVYRSEQLKDSSEIFMEFYKINDIMLTNIILLGNEVSALASEIQYENNKIAS